MFQVDPNNFGGWLKRRQGCRSQPASVLAGEERKTSQAPNTSCCANPESLQGSLCTCQERHHDRQGRMNTCSRAGSRTWEKTAISSSRETWDLQASLEDSSWLLIYNPLGQVTQKLDADYCKIMSLGAGRQSRWHTLNGAVTLLGWPGERWKTCSETGQASALALQKVTKLNSDRDCRQNNFPDNMMHGG